MTQSNETDTQKHGTGSADKATGTGPGAGSGLDNARIVVGLETEWLAMSELLADLSDEEWSQPSILPGWSVHDVVAHLVGTERMLEGQTPPPVRRDLRALGHVRNDTAAMNEQWVDSMRGLRPDQMLEGFVSITRTRADKLRAMSREELDAASWTPAGQATYGRFMQIRVYDCWLHEQDIRDSLRRPGHDSGLPAEIALDEATLALGFVIGKKAGAPQGSKVTFDITGAVPRTIHVAVSGRAEVVEALPAAADVTLGLTHGLFMRLAGGRVDAASHMKTVAMTGDTELGRRVIEALAFTI